MQPIFNDDDLMVKLNVIHKLRKALQREGHGYQSVLHRRFGVGLSEADFDLCVRMLLISDWCTVTKGERDATILTFNQAFSDVNPRSPEEVIAHATQCPPITEELIAEVK